MKLNPHLRFNDDKCAEAIEFYKNCFPGAKVEPMYLKNSPMAKDMPESGNKIMHALFQAREVEFSMSDMMRDKAVIGDQISIMVNCDNEKEAQELFKKLSAGGDVFMPLEKQFWGAWFGVVTDKYGIEWDLNCPVV
jgi:PhnB protein